MAENREEFTSAIPLGDKEIIWSHPTDEQLPHYASDPRGRVMMVIRDPDGVPVGSAMMVDADIISAQGPQRVPILESVCLPAQSAGGLLAAFNFAAELHGSPTTILASNLSCVEHRAIRTAGARSLPSLFNAYVFFKARDTRLANASRLNLEVI